MDIPDIAIAMRSAQASHPTFELHSLGWKAFQHLCVSVASEVWGQVVQGFFDSHDGGRDGAFYGTWIPKAGEALEGSFAAQCKFSQKPNRTLKLSDLRDELSKAARLADRGLADNYILFTNMQLTGNSDGSIRAAFERIQGIKQCVIFGCERISQFIQESPRLRMLVPRVYGLGDLGQILDHRAYAQAQEILSALGDDMTKFVITDAYQSSAKAIVEHGFVLLLGEPACGKSSIAAALALGALDEWGCSTIKARDANDFVVHSNPHEPKQFFWVDDAFGATQLDWQSALQWNSAFPHVRAAIRRGARFVFTSRDYIYRNARNLLKESALPILNESQVVIRVEQLSKDEREQILYNHIRLGSQPSEFKKSVKPHLSAVAGHTRFSPEIARRLGNPAFTKKLHLTAGGLSDFVEHPVELLQEVIRTLDAGSRAAIALVFMRGGSLASPIALGEEEKMAIALLGATQADVRKSLMALDGSLLVRVQQQGFHSWRAKHPTILDAFAALVSEDRELMDIYLAGTPVRQLFLEIACGDSQLEGTKVEVPTDRYEGLMSRIEHFSAKSAENSKAVNRFLAFRCGTTFLEKFLERNHEFTSSLYIISYFYAVSDIDVINKLHRVGLLPELERLRHLEAVRELAVSTPDAGFLKASIIGFLSEAEIAEILLHVREELLPNLGREISVWRDNYSDSEDPEDYFSHFKTALMDYAEALDDDPLAQARIEEGISEIDEAIEKLRSDVSDEGEPDEYYRDKHNAPRALDARSIFDDVDE
ncbi:MAG TPA: hypothetical protein VIF88_13355 [Methylocystis sp.]|jgi:hypothetical protein